MKQVLMLILVAASIVASYVVFMPTTDTPNKVVQGLPWQIDQLASGHTQVFGLTLGQTVLHQVEPILGDDYELAILVGPDQQPRLEMYYGHFRAGPVSGRLILNFVTEHAQLEKFMQQNSKADFTSSGSRKYLIDQTAQEQLAAQELQQILFIPVVQLEQEMIQSRFGTPAQVDQPEPEVTRMLYPKLGLEVALHHASKDVLRYTSPTIDQ